MLLLLLCCLSFAVVAVCELPGLLSRDEVNPRGLVRLELHALHGGLGAEEEGREVELNRVLDEDVVAVRDLEVVNESVAVEHVVAARDEVHFGVQLVEREGRLEAREARGRQAHADRVAEAHEAACRVAGVGVRGEGVAAEGDAAAAAAFRGGRWSRGGGDPAGVENRPEGPVNQIPEAGGEGQALTENPAQSVDALRLQGCWVEPVGLSRLRRGNGERRG